MAQVSVIIPTYNRARFLGGAIRSVLAQSYKDFEIIVVDDCGGDDAESVVRSCGARGVRYVKHDRQRGGAAARNTGISVATGEYIAFLDDDDEWYPEKLGRQVNAMLESPPEVGGVYTGYFIIDRADGQIRGQMVPTERGDIYPALLAGNCVGGTSCMLLRRSCFDKVGFFDERLKSFQDYDLWLRTARKFRFDCIREPLLRYYVHGDKIWTNPKALSQGLELMLKKYGDAAPFRKKCANYYLALGVQHCEANRFDEGRKALLRAARLNPMTMAPYGYLVLALLGVDNFRRARQAQGRLRVARGQRPQFGGGIAENA